MEDPTVFQGINPHFPEHEQLKCPRCDSTNTKFCYYNNYNLSQPRYYCKNCRRYWTKGGTLRNIPVGGGSRKNNKRPNPKKASAFSSPSSSSSSTTAASLQSVPKSESVGVHGGPAVDHDHRMLDVSGSFSSLLYSNEQLGNLMESVNSGASLAPQGLHFSECVENGNSNANSIAGAAGDSTMELAESRCWNGPNGWPDLAIYTPDSKFQ